MYTSLLEPEKYISIKIPFYYRKALAWFRCSKHKFRIETGRHISIDHDFRYCTHCLNVENTYVIEEEFQVFLEHNMHLFSCYSRSREEIDFINLINMKHDLNLKKIALFIYFLMRKA